MGLSFQQCLILVPHLEDSCISYITATPFAYLYVTVMHQARAHTEHMHQWLVVSLGTEDLEEDGMKPGNRIALFSQFIVL